MSPCRNIRSCRGSSLSPVSQRTRLSLGKALSLQLSLWQTLRNCHKGHSNGLCRPRFPFLVPTITRGVYPSLALSAEFLPASGIPRNSIFISAASREQMLFAATIITWVRAIFRSFSPPSVHPSGFTSIIRTGRGAGPLIPSIGTIPLLSSRRHHCPRSHCSHHLCRPSTRGHSNFC